MKTRQQFMRAVFAKECSNAKNLSREKESTDRYLLIDKKTEKTVIDCRVYMGRSSSASTVYASIWVSVSDKKKPDSWTYGYTSGHGSAGGYGYHKTSAAIGDAIRSAGIELYGSPYLRSDRDEGMKKRCDIGGVGDTAVRAALRAIAYAAGFTDCIEV